MKLTFFHPSLLRSLKLFTVTLVLLAPLTSSFASGELCPNWVKGGYRANESYLVRTGVEYVPTLNDELFDAGTSRNLREEYETRTRKEEARSNAGLVEQYEEKARFGVMKDFANRAVNSIYMLRLKLEGDRITKVAQNSNLPKEPIAAAVFTASLYNGRSMRIRVFDGTPVDTRVVLKDKVAQVTVPFASLGATATVAYNGICPLNNGCALVTKQIGSNVSAQLNSAEKGSARLVYSVSF